MLEDILTKRERNYLKRVIKSYKDDASVTYYYETYKKDKKEYKND